MRIIDPKEKGLPSKKVEKVNKKIQIDAVDINSRKHYGIVEPVKINNKKTKLTIVPKKNDIKYTNLKLDIILPVPYESIIQHTKLGLKNLKDIVEISTEAYDKLINKDIKLHRIKYVFKPYNETETDDDDERQTNKQLKQDLNEYLQIPKKIREIKEAKEFDVDEYKKLAHRKSALHKKLVEYDVITKNGDLK